MIRRANEFTGEEIYMFKTLKIPFTKGKIYDSFARPGESEDNKEENIVSIMNGILKERYQTQSDYAKEAKFYLESNGYSLDRALQDFEDDMGN